MKRLVIAVLAAAAVAATGGAVAAATPDKQVPILFNDHHVPAAPDTLTRGRVLAALVRNGTLLVPLRSMFEQMGATVSYDAASKTATVSKPGSEIKVTVGKPEVIVNGESRPLDVPPAIVNGTVVVPVRVISEGMGAYVQWVPDQHVVVVRYVPPTPPPTPEPTAAPATPAPLPSAPPPVPQATPYRDLFVAGDYLISPRVYDEFSPGNSGSGSWSARGAYEFNVFDLPFMIEGTWQQFQYPHNGSPGTVNAICNGVGGHARPGSAGCVTIVGGGASLNVPAFTPSDSDFDGRFGMKLLKQRVYIVFAYQWKSNNYGYANMNGFGEGIEKLPDLDQPLSFFGSWVYYPKIKGTMTTGNPPFGFALEYIVTTYDVGVSYVVGGPVFVEAGWNGQSWVSRQFAPSNRTYSGAFVGLGLKF